MCREKVKRQIEREKKIVQILSTLCGALTRSPGSVLRSRAVSETSLTLNSLSHNETHRKKQRGGIRRHFFFLRIESSARFRSSNPLLGCTHNRSKQSNAIPSRKHPQANLLTSTHESNDVLI